VAAQPAFYEEALGFVKRKMAVAINRVEVADEWNGRKLGFADIDTIIALAKETPQRHHGFDCFIWLARNLRRFGCLQLKRIVVPFFFSYFRKRELTPLIRIAVGNLCVGYPPLGNVFVDALRCAAPRFEVSTRSVKWCFERLDSDSSLHRL
jgi:hypothetical protein